MSEIREIPNPERDEMLADLATVRRLAPDVAEAMKTCYDAYIAAGFDHTAALEFVAEQFLRYD